MDVYVYPNASRMHSYIKNVNYERMHVQVIINKKTKETAIVDPVELSIM